MQFKTEAFVIHSLRYAEGDLIVKLFTKKEGVNSYLLRRVLKTKKGKISASFFQPMSFLNIDAVHVNKNSLHKLREAKPTIQFQSLHTNVIKGSVVMFVAEILNQVLVENHPDEVLFDFIKTFLVWLDHNENISLSPQFFLLKLSKFLGFYPEQINQDFSHFSLQEGRFEMFSKSTLCITGQELTSFKTLLGINFDVLSNTTMLKFDRLRLLENLLVYFSIHIEGFKKPKSMGVIQELFN